MEYFVEKDIAVKSYDTQVLYEINERIRSLDILIEYFDGNKKVIEIKPKKRLSEFFHLQQMEDSKNNALANSYGFEIWTEENLDITNSKDATALADAYRKKHYLIDYAAHRTKKDQERAKRHYDKNIKDAKVEVYCDYCEEVHHPLRLTYEKNIAKNSNYICERRGGYIAGNKPKKKKINPYAAEGKKHCIGHCDKVLLFENFSPDNSRNDGYCSKCKECRATINKERYQQRINKEK